jgi:glyoxylate reductase
MNTGDKYKIVSFSPYPPEIIKILFMPYMEDMGFKADLEINVFTDISDREKVYSVLEEADIVIGDFTFSIPIDKDMIQHMKRVRLIQQPSTGYDHIDIKAAREKGIPVANVGGANTVSVAEHTIAMALLLLKRMIQSHFKVQNGLWPQQEMFDLGIYELDGKTWGIIGMGRIGREVAKRVKVFGVKVIYYDINRLPKEVEEKLGVEYRPFNRLVSEADIISIHVPLTPDTRHMIGEKELRRMKGSAIIINPSRGEIIDENALAEALKNRWIFGAGVDVYSQEPPPKDHPLLNLEDVNLITTPHIAGATNEARQRIIATSVKNVIKVLMGEKPDNVVNM